MQDLEKINSFIGEHHVMTLATSYKDDLSACSLFYAYSEQHKSFVVASSDSTLHVKHVNKNPYVAGNILLETKSVGKIQGVQFRGEFFELKRAELEELYFKNFPYARALMPKLWELKVTYFKMTDNCLGFGKKIIWQEPSEQT